MLVNVGPPAHGHIAPIYEERLRQMGAWLKVNGEGIYGSKPWTFQNDTLTPGVWSVTHHVFIVPESLKKTYHLGKSLFLIEFEDLKRLS